MTAATGDDDRSRRWGWALTADARRRRPEQVLPLTFEDLASGSPPRAGPDDLVPIESAGPGDAQVLVARAPGATPEPEVALDGLAAYPGVRSVVASAVVRADRPMPSIRELLFVGSGVRPGVDPATLARLPALETLWAGRAPYRHPLELEALPAGGLRALAVERAMLRAGGAVAGLEAVARLTGLRSLIVEGAYPSDSVAPLAALRDLVRLRAGAPAGWRTLSALTALEMVEMYRARLADLRPLSGWQHLRSLTISMGSLASLEGIEAFSSLESLTLVALRIPDLGPLSGLPALAELSLLDVDGVRDIGPVGTLPSLRRLAIRASPGGARRNVGPAAIATLRPLAGLARLETLELRVGVEDGDLGSLVDLPALRRVELTGAPGPQVARLRAARPDLDLALHDVPAGPAGVAVAGVTIHPPAAGQPRWWIFEDLAERLGTATNADAETLVRLAITARDAALSERVRYDAEAGGVAIEAPTEADIRSVAAIVGGLSSALR